MLIGWLRADESSKCSVEAIDHGGHSATLGCLMSYQWHAQTMQFNAMPHITASLRWDAAPGSVSQVLHPSPDAPPVHSGRLESIARVNISSPNDISRHTCTISFNFSPGTYHTSKFLYSQ